MKTLFHKLGLALICICFAVLLQSCVQSEQAVPAAEQTKTKSTNGAAAPSAAAQSASQKSSNADAELSYYIGTFNVFIPGGSYTTDNYAAETRTVTTFAGAADGTLTLKKDNTFSFNKSTLNWNPKKKEYSAGVGEWSKTNDPEYPIVLNDKAAGKLYKIGKSTPKLGGDIIIWEEGATWSIGTKK